MPILAVAALAVLFTSGCAGPEEKLGLGMRNTYEIARWGELRRSIEQTSVFESPEAGFTTGVVRGFDRSLARTGMGLYEMATFPLPPYHPIFTKYLAAEPVYPESYSPNILSDSMFDTDTYTGYSGGDVAPWLIGSRFSVFPN